MTRVTKGIILSLAGAIIIGLVAGISVILSRNNAFSQKQQSVSSGIIDDNDADINTIGADNKSLSTFKNFDDMVSVLKARGYFSQRNYSRMEATDDAVAPAQGGATNGKSAETSASSGSSAGYSTDSVSGTPSETNTQVSGVDEGDIVKTDGIYIYSLGENKVRIIDPKNAADMKVVATITIDNTNSYASEMYIYKDKLVLIGNYYDQSKTSDKEFYTPENYGISVKVYSLADIKNPVIFREFKVQGNLSSTRLIEDNLYLITAKGLYFADEKNMKPETILPQYYDSTSASKNFKMISEKEVNYCPDSDLNSFLNIASFSINDTKEAYVETILGGAGTVYMNKHSLIVAYGVYEDVKSLNPSATPKIAVDSIMATGYQNTVILKFNVNGLSVKYAASAKVPGSLLNQFALDENNGFLRVATTSFKETTQNNVYIYDTALKQTGKLEGLAPGERIYSVRYEGNIGYIVTYRQTDPLFVIDLSDTSAPKVLGELKIPGFSNYMHMVGENLVLGIGRDTQEQEVTVQNDIAKMIPESNGNTAQSTEPSKRTVVTTGGIKISLFDVSDKANPKELDTVVIGDSSAYCEAQYNHKALIYDSKSGKLYLPFTFVSSDLKSRKMYTGAVISVSGKSLTEDHYFETDAVSSGDNYGYYNYNGTRFCYIGSTLFQINSVSITSYNKNTYEKIGSLSL